MKHTAILALVAAAIASSAVMAAPEEHQLHVAALLPLTGGISDQGNWCRQGIEIAQTELKGRLKVEFEDTAGDPKAALSEATNLNLRAPLHAIVGYLSGVAMALSPFCNQNKIVQMNVAANTTAYRSLDDFNLRNCPSSAEEGRFIAKAFAAKGMKRIAVLHIENDYGVSTAAEFKLAFAAKGGEVVFGESVPPGTSDLRTVLLRLRRTSPEAVLLVLYPAEGAVALKELRASNFPGKLYGSVALVGGSSFLSIAGSSAEGAAILFTKQPRSERQFAFTQAYLQAFNAPYTVQHYVAGRCNDAIHLLYSAWEQCGAKSTECLKAKLHRIRDFNGVASNYTFDAYGDVEYDFEFHVVRNGQFELAE